MANRASLLVDTPYGEGVFQLARFLLGCEYHYIVRVKVTDASRPHLKDRNCLTHSAQVTALFAFTAEELGLTKKQVK